MEKSGQIPVIIPSKIVKNEEYWKVYCYSASIFVPNNRENIVSCILIDFDNPEHERNVIEVVSHVFLRRYFSLNDGDRIGFFFR